MNVFSPYNYYIISPDSCLIYSVRYVVIWYKQKPAKLKRPWNSWWIFWESFACRIFIEAWHCLCTVVHTENKLLSVIGIQPRSFEIVLSILTFHFNNITLLPLPLLPLVHPHITMVMSMHNYSHKCIPVHYNC